MDRRPLAPHRDISKMIGLRPRAAHRLPPPITVFHHSLTPKNICSTMRGKRHIGGAGRANETGIPPTSPLRSSAPCGSDVRILRVAVDAGLGSAQEPPARNPPVTQDSIRGLTRKRGIAFRVFQMHARIRPGRSHTHFVTEGRRPLASPGPTVHSRVSRPGPTAPPARYCFRDDTERW